MLFIGDSLEIDQIVVGGERSVCSRMVSRKRGDNGLANSPKVFHNASPFQNYSVCLKF